MKKFHKGLLIVLMAAACFLAGRFQQPVLEVVAGSTAKAQSSTKDIAWRSPSEQRVIDIYGATNEAVVFITTINVIVDPFDFYSGVKRSEGTGSGVIIDAVRGIILTNLHVIQNAQRIEILLADGTSHLAKLTGYDEQYDLAVLKLNQVPKSLTGIELGNSAKLAVGQQVLAIGNPHGLNRTLTTGVISSVDRSVRNPNNFLMRGLIQTDAAINPGNSGGPLLDLDGRLIGINTAILSRSGDSAGIGFSIPINQIKQVLPELIRTGKVSRPSFGWALIDTNVGPMIQRVFSDSPAAAQAVQPLERPVTGAFVQGFIRDFSRAEIIMSINGNAVSNKEEVEEYLSSIKRDESVEFEFRLGSRRGPKRVVSIKPEWQ